MIVRILESDTPLSKISLHQPPGEVAWVLQGRIVPGAPLIYVKLQVLRGSTVLLRSFHPIDHDQH